MSIIYKNVQIQDKRQQNIKQNIEKRIIINLDRSMKKPQRTSEQQNIKTWRQSFYVSNRNFNCQKFMNGYGEKIVYSFNNMGVTNLPITSFRRFKADMFQTMVQIFKIIWLQAFCSYFNRQHMDISFRLSCLQSWRRKFFFVCHYLSFYHTMDICWHSILLSFPKIFHFQSRCVKFYPICLIQ